jgi:uncharacterized membrane protein
VLTPLTVSAGEWLYNREDAHSPILQTHEERGETMLYFSIALLVMALAIAALHIRAARSDKPQKAAAVVVAIVAVLVGVSSIVQVIRIGHTGTQAKWGEIAE